MKIIEYLIDDLESLGVDEVALVAKPAIQKNFEAFAEVSFDDYPESVVEAAKRGIDLNESINNKCATQVGKVRAQQLANREKVSIDTIQRMRAFLIRQKGNYDLAVERRDYTACGYVSYLLWGGPDALPWSERKLKEIEQNFAASKISFDFDGVLSTAAGKAKAIEEMSNGNEVYVVSARNTEESMYSVTDALGIPRNNVFATGSNRLKIEKIKELGIVKHYDNNSDVINELGITGEKFKFSDEDLFELLLKEEFALDVSALPNYVDEIKSKLQSELNEKRMVIGPLMTPDKLILRKDKKTGELYQVFFTEDTIRKIAHKLMKSKLIDAVNIEHNPNQKVEDVYLVEIWICEDPEHDKSTLYGFEPTVGELYAIYKIDNEEIWTDYIKTGLVKGFSIEGYFAENLISE